MSGAVLLLPQYTFMVWTGTLPFYILLITRFLSPSHSENREAGHPHTPTNAHNLHTITNHQCM